jgi:hypothetical protein
MGHAEAPENHLWRDARIRRSWRTGLLLRLQMQPLRHRQRRTLAGHVRLSDLKPRFVRTACGRHGADIRADFALGQAGPAHGDY